MGIGVLAVAGVFALSALSLVPLSATPAHGADGLALGAVLVGLRHWTLMFIYIYTAVGGLMLGYMLLRTRLVPRGMSVLGLVGYAALLLAAVLDMLGVIDTVGGIGLVGLVPGGVFDFVLPIWLIARGFNPTTVDATRL